MRTKQRMSCAASIARGIGLANGEYGEEKHRQGLSTPQNIPRSQWLKDATEQRGSVRRKGGSNHVRNIGGFFPFI